MTTNHLSTSVLFLVVTAATSVADEAQDTLPQYLIGYNQGVSYWPGNPKKLLGDAMINGENHPVSMDLDGRNKQDLTGNSTAYTYGAQVAPDGKRIAYHSVSDSS
jgi:hypothetical protein